MTTNITERANKQIRALFITLPIPLARSWDLAAVVRTLKHSAFRLTMFGDTIRAHEPRLAQAITANSERAMKAGEIQILDHYNRGYSRHVVQH